MAINKSVFIHDADKAALATLKAIPGFTQVLRAFMKVWNEKFTEIENMATKVQLSEEQLPYYYRMLDPICDKLGIDKPELYLELSPFANAYTTGDTKPSITITSGLIETLPDELISTVLAHECGHIACHHVLYTTMGRMILSGALNALPLNLAKTAFTPIIAAFSYWMRCSEYSADRAAILCDGTPDKLFEVCMRLAGFDKDIAHSANLDAFFNQAKQYRTLVEENKVNKAMELYRYFLNDHPLHSVRALEAKEWAESENFIKSKQYFDSYSKDEKPSEIPVSWNEKHFLNRDVDEVEDEFLSYGFEEINLIRITDKALFTKENTVINVDIRGNDKYREGDWIPVDSIVDITYYLPLSDDEIALLHPGEIKMPVSNKAYVGRPYEEVVKELEEIGFENISVDLIKDITKVNDKNIGRIASITIDKDPKFSKGDWIDESALIEIVYHSAK